MAAIPLLLDQGEWINASYTARYEAMSEIWDEQEGIPIPAYWKHMLWKKTLTRQQYHRLAQDWPMDGDLEQCRLVIGAFWLPDPHFEQ